jgi:haloalkane dehalogenase
LKTLFRAVTGTFLALAVVFAGFAGYLLALGPDPVERDQRQMSKVWHEYPFVSHYIQVNGHQMHYVDEGDPEGPVFLFLHGNPTSSYLWRHVVPVVAAAGGRAIAVDNIGFGASDRPDMGYTFVEHAEHIEGFVDALGLKEITLVIHDWGSGLGFDYAYRHQENVRGIAFMESIIGSGSIEDLENPMRAIFTAFRTPAIGEFLVLVQNVFIESGLQASVVRELSENELNAYREPFPTWGSRIPVLVWPREIPFDGVPANTSSRVDAYSKWLPQSELPKLMLFAEPGGIIPRAVAEEMAMNWGHLDTQFIGAGLHFVQEDHGTEIGQAIVQWASSIGAFNSDSAP